MPRDLSGNYTLPAGNPVVNATTITPAWGNTTLSDIAAQLNNVITRDGLLGATAPITFVAGLVGAPGIAFSASPSTGLFAPATGVLAISSVGTERARFDSSTTTPILLTGTVSLIGAPSVNTTTAGTMSPTGPTGLIVKPTFADNTGAAVVSNFGSIISAVAGSSSTGSAAIYGTVGAAAVSASSAASPLLILGGYFVSNRDNAADLSVANNTQYGIFAFSRVLATVAPTATASLVVGAAGQASILGGAGATTVRGIWALTVLNSSAGALNMAFTDVHGYDHSPTFGVPSGGGLTTITNLYGLRLRAPTINTGVTITNRYGVSSEDASAINYFAGMLGVGVVPGAWVSTSKAIQYTTASEGMDSSSQWFGAFNARESSAGVWTALSTDEVSVLQLDNAGGLLLRTAAATSSGTAATLASRLQVSNNGVTTITTSSGTPLRINAGSDAFQIDNSTSFWQVGTTGNFPFRLLTNGLKRAEILGTGELIQVLPAAAPTLANSEMNFALTSNTNLRVTVRGTDGTLRTANIPLA